MAKLLEQSPIERKITNEFTQKMPDEPAAHSIATGLFPRTTCLEKGARHRFAHDGRGQQRRRFCGSGPHAVNCLDGVDAETVCSVGGRDDDIRLSPSEIRAMTRR